MVLTEMAAMTNLFQGLFGELMQTIRTVKIRYQATDYHFSSVKQVTLGEIRKKERAPIYEFTSPRKQPVRITKLQVLFDDTPDANYRPRVKITVNDAPIFETDYSHLDDNPFLNYDLSLDFGTGKTLERDDKIKFFIWRDGANDNEKKITISTSLGEY